MKAEHTEISEKERGAPSRARPRVCYEWTTEEVVMMRFLDLCVPSLDPDSYEGVLVACRNLSLARPKLSKGSTLKCLKEIFGDDYELPEREALR